MGVGPGKGSRWNGPSGSPLPAPGARLDPVVEGGGADAAERRDRSHRDHRAAGRNGWRTTTAEVTVVEAYLVVHRVFRQRMS